MNYQWQLNFHLRARMLILFCVNIPLFLYLVPSQCNVIHIGVAWNFRQMRESKVKVSQMC